MKKIFSLCIVISMLIPLPVLAVTVKLVDNVTLVGVQHWAADRACIQIGTERFKLDLSTENGRASYSLAMAAFSSNTKLEAKWRDTSPLEGGCDSGTTMYPLYSLRMVR